MMTSCRKASSARRELGSSGNVTLQWPRTSGGILQQNRERATNRPPPLRRAAPHACPGIGLVRKQPSDYNDLMNRQGLYRLLRPGNPEAHAVLWRVAHHSMVAIGIGLMLALTVPEWRALYGDSLSDAFDIVALFFVLDFALRFYAAPGAPGGEHRGIWRSRLSWLISLGGTFDLLAAIPGFVALPDSRDATLIGFIWVFKYVRYSPGLSILERVITNT